MDQDIQEAVNRAAKNLRIQVIEFLIKKDCMDYNQAIPSDEELAYRKHAINNLPCCTKLLKKLFRDAHDMHEEKGMFPHAVCISDLEWCLKNRNIGYGCSQSVKMDWLPYKEDAELRRLPGFVELANIYRPLLDAGKNILPPINKKAIESEALQIINGVAENLKGE